MASPSPHPSQNSNDRWLRLALIFGAMALFRPVMNKILESQGYETPKRYSAQPTAEPTPFPQYIVSLKKRSNETGYRQIVPGQDYPTVAKLLAVGETDIAIAPLVARPGLCSVLFQQPKEGRIEIYFENGRVALKEQRRFFIPPTPVPVPRPF